MVHVGDGMLRWGVHRRGYGSAADSGHSHSPAHQRVILRAGVAGGGWAHAGSDPLEAVDVQV